MSQYATEYNKSCLTTESDGAEVMLDGSSFHRWQHDRLERQICWL